MPYGGPVVFVGLTVSIPFTRATIFNFLTASRSLAQVYDRIALDDYSSTASTTGALTIGGPARTGRVETYGDSDDFRSA